jgi:cell division protease FtsH
MSFFAKKTSLLILVTYLLGGTNSAFGFYRQAQGDDFEANLKKAQLAIGITAGVMYIGFIAYAIYKAKHNGESGISPAQNCKQTFADVAGADQAKLELQEVVDYLKDPKKYTALGAKVSKGVLLIGEPGNGKTLLARAVAGEANCAFYSMSGSEFINTYVGVGAAKVRELFAKANKSAPSIIFIDEIDAIGGERSKNQLVGEYTQTLNQLLTCMDGFNQADHPVIVIAATNQASGLDKALLRPGRFDRIIKVEIPDLKARTDILNIYLKKIVVDPGIDVNKIALGTIGFSGADLAQLVNQAALIAIRAGKSQVDIDDFEEARDLVLIGAKNQTRKYTDQDRKVTAYHEAGHGLVGLMLPNMPSVLHKITIMPRGQTLGVAYNLPDRERSHGFTKDEFLAQIMMACGGRAAEELVFGHITTGAVSDFASASSIARKMVCEYGMSNELGMVVYDSSLKDGYFMSQKTSEQIDMAVHQIINTCYAQAKEIIIKNRDKLDILAQGLLEKETLYINEICELLGLEPRRDLRLTA